MECRKYKTRMISDIMLWGLGPNQWLQKLHRYTNQIVTSIFQTGFFIFFISLGTCPRLCSSTRNVDCASSLRYCVILNRHAYACHFFGPILNSSLKILIPTKTTRKAATMRFVVSSLVLDCIKGNYAGVFGDSTSTTSFLSLRSKLHLNFTNVPHAVH